MTGHPVLIVADDLTGACDTAGAVVGICGPVDVHLQGRRVRKADGEVGGASGGPGTVTAIDLDSRSGPVAQAVQRTVAAVSAAPGHVYLKIDSTLRGHVVSTVSAAAGAFRARHHCARVLVCPAFPARGRLVVDRRVVVDGTALESVVLDELAALAGVEVADAVTDGDLAALAGHGGAEPVLWVGSAGLAPHAVAAAGAASPVATIDAPRARVVTVVVGSEQAASADGAAALLQAADDRLRVLVGDPRRATFADDAVAALSGADALVVTGGYTARRVLERLGVAGLRVCGELEPGIPWSMSDGPVRTVVTKAGGFGDEGTLRRLVDRLLRPAESA